MKQSTGLSIVIDNAFDLIALLCHFIHSAPEDEAVIAFQICSSDIELQKQKIEEQFSYLNRRGTTESVTYMSVSREQCIEMAQAATEWVVEKNYSAVLGLLVYLDDYIDFEKSLLLFMASQKQVCHNIYQFESLNESNRCLLRGRLIPRIIPLWRKPNYSCPMALAQNPLGLIRNYSWLSDNEWHINNFFLDDEIVTDSKPLKVICSALTAKSPFEVLPDEQEMPYTFAIEYKTGEENVILERIIGTLKYASVQGAHCVLFPEMLASPAILNACQDYIKNTWELNFPPLIFLPTAEYVTEAGDVVNEMRILDRNGRRITSYYKQNAFRLRNGTGKHYFERIKPDKQLVVFHVKNVGRIGVLICSDAFQPDIRKLLLENFGLDLLLISVFSKGWDAFNRALTYYNASSCDIVWCNTCAAYGGHGEKRMIIYYPYGHKDPQPTDLKGCADVSKCAGCVTMIEIPTEYAGSNEITYVNLSRGEQDE
ncbi:MAG: hypothetical protein IKT52_07815 [Oscillospiraceae bacterium]|nr:hypothetical protein [Oscillospiraceae bacterium]